MIPKGLQRVQRAQVMPLSAAAGLVGALGTNQKIANLTFRASSQAKSYHFSLCKKKIPHMGPYGPPQSCGPPKKVRGVPPCARPCSLPLQIGSLLGKSLTLPVLLHIGSLLGTCLSLPLHIVSLLGKSFSLPLWLFLCLSHKV